MMDFSKNIDKASAFHSIQEYIQSLKLSILSKDEKRPWGGFFVIDDTSVSTFIDHFFPEFEKNRNGQKQELSPKILLVEPGKRLSWQYHHRRSEVWKIINGPVGIVLSDDNNQTPVQSFNTGQILTIDKGQRHRLVGLKDWGVVAEIWKHTDSSNPSGEKDIVRLEDDYGR